VSDRVLCCVMLGAKIIGPQVSSSPKAIHTRNRWVKLRAASGELSSYPIGVPPLPTTTATYHGDSIEFILRGP